MSYGTKVKIGEIRERIGFLKGPDGSDVFTAIHLPELLSKHPPEFDEYYRGPWADRDTMKAEEHFPEAIVELFLAVDLAKKQGYRDVEIGLLSEEPETYDTGGTRYELCLVGTRDENTFERKRREGCRKKRESRKKRREEDQEKRDREDYNRLRKRFGKKK